VQAAAGRERLGAAAASVAFSRSLGAAAGAALMGAVLFGSLALGSGAAAEGFARLAAEGPGALGALSPEAGEAIRKGLADAFRAMFLFAAVLMLAASFLAWRVPLRRF
jgi:hypothetical protein